MRKELEAESQLRAVVSHMYGREKWAGEAIQEKGPVSIQQDGMSAATPF